MRYILLIAAFLSSSLAYGQGTWNKANTNNAWNRTKSDSVAIVPRDTIATNNAILPSTGQPVGDYGRIQAKNKRFYFHDSIRNRKIAFLDEVVSAQQINDSLNTLTLERVTTTASGSNIMSRELITDAGSGFGRVRLFTANGVQNRIYSMTTGAGAFRPLLFASGGVVVSHYSGGLLGWDGVSSFQVNGDGAFNGIVAGLNATAANHFVTRSQVTDTLTARLSAYSPVVPAWQAVMNAGNTSTLTPHVTNEEGLRINDDNGYTSFYNSAGGTRTGFFQISNSSGALLTTDLALPILFQTNGVGNTRMTITAAGDVGIGTTPAASFKLHVAGLGKFSNTNSNLNFGELDANTTFIQSVNAASSAGKDLAFFNAAERMRILAGGNVGIGTSTPQASLHVQNANGLGVVVGNNGNAIDGMNGNSYDALYINHFSPSNVFIGSGGGNVGVGTTTPVSKLEAKGPVVFSRIAPTGGVYPHLKLANESSLTRWEFGTLGLEGPDPAGFDLLIRRYNNAGAVIGGTPIYIKREDGTVGINVTPFAGFGLHVGGGGTLLAGGSTTKPPLIISGGEGHFVRTITATTTLDAQDYYVRGNNSSDIVINLPQISSMDGNILYRIKKISNNANTITITAFSGDLIDGLTTVVLSTYNSSVDIIIGGPLAWDVL